MDGVSKTPLLGAVKRRGKKSIGCARSFGARIVPIPMFFVERRIWGIIREEMTTDIKYWYLLLQDKPEVT